MAIRAIIFDLEGVLAKTKDNDVSATIAKKLNAPYEKVYDLMHSEWNDRIDLGEITQDQFNTHVVDNLEIAKDKAYLISQVMDEETFIDDAFMKQVEALRKEYKIGLLTNYSIDMRGKLEDKWKISGAFDEIIISCEVGLLKPDAAVFNLMLERLGVQAHEAVFIDDRIKNIEGAKLVGIRTIFYETREQTLGELERILGE